MHSTKLVIQEDGSLLAVFHPNQVGEVGPLETFGTIEEDRRGGHVWPVNPVKRIAFKLLRQVFGSAGQVADWTRAWRGPWSVWDAVTLEQVAGEYATHGDAVAAEIEWIVEEKSHE